MRGVDLEIVGQAGDEDFVVPSRVWVNGIELLIPAESPIIINELTSRNVVTATITMVLRTLRIGPDDDS